MKKIDRKDIRKDQDRIKKTFDNDFNNLKDTVKQVELINNKSNELKKI